MTVGLFAILKLRMCHKILEILPRGGGPFGLMTLATLISIREAGNSFFHVYGRTGRPTFNVERDETLLALLD